MQLAPETNSFEETMTTKYISFKEAMTTQLLDFVQSQAGALSPADLDQLIVDLPAIRPPA
jgi:hypothetical protein